MAEENDGGEKTEEPSARKLEQARSQGDVVKTPDLPQLLSLTGAAAVVATMGGWMCRNLATGLVPFLAHPDAISLEGGGGQVLARHLMMIAGPIVLMVLLTAGLGGAIGNLMQTGLMLTPSKLAPDFKKISPLGGLKRMFGLDSLIQWAKSLIKLAAVAVLVWSTLKPHWTEMTNLVAVDPRAMLPFCADILKRLVFSVAALMLVLAGADWMIQKQRYMARMRMTKEEIKEDFKQTEGDPHVKARQKQIRAERAKRRMMANVPKATVVIMNPTHYAVALKYTQGEDEAPLCVAKGLDNLALKIREVAEEAKVPVIEDPPLARALYAAVEIDEMIPPAHYEAVAKVIGFILNAGRRRAARRPL